MKYTVIYLSLLLLLQGCQSPANMTPHEPVAAVPCRESSRINTWLLARERLCQLTTDEQRHELTRLFALPQPTEQQKIKQILLASCRSDLTPGLLMEALNGLNDTATWPAEEQAFINTFRATAHSYRLLDEKSRQLSERNKELETQLEATIEGIRNIETDMERLKRSGSTP